ncbi:hypothetical protein KR52_11215 [Synechococcus sp. KORDI-52]|nr:hypothetical protein KR52_11215 [Synechococcus sp. KORDI-52]
MIRNLCLKAESNNGSRKITLETMPQHSFKPVLNNYAF